MSILHRLPKLPQIGVGSRILLCFALVGVLTMSALLLSSIKFSQIEAEFQVLKHERVPQIAASADVSSGAHDISYAIGAVSSAPDIEALDKAASQLKTARSEMRQVLENLSPGDGRTNLEKSSTSLTTVTNALIQDKHDLLEHRAKIASDLEALLDARAIIQRDIQVVIQQSRAGLSMAEAQAIWASRNKVLKLVEEDLIRYQLLLAARVHLNSVVGVAASFAALPPGGNQRRLRGLSIAERIRLTKAIEQYQEMQVPLDPSTLDAINDVQTHVQKLLDGQTSPDQLASQSNLIALQQARRTADGALDLLTTELGLSLSDQAMDAVDGSVQVIQNLINNEVKDLETALSLSRSVDNQVLLLTDSLTLTDKDMLVKRQSQAERKLNALHQAANASGQDINDHMQVIDRLSAVEGGMFETRLLELEKDEAVEANERRGLEEVAAMGTGAETLVANSLDAISNSARAVQSSLDRAQSQIFALGCLILLVIVAVGTGVVWLGTTRPLRRLAAATSGLAKGDLTVDPGYHEARNEFGRISRALSVFRDNVAKFNALSEQARIDREAQEALRVETLDRLRRSLGRVARTAAEGDLSARVTETFDDDVLTALADDMNLMISRLDEALSETSTVLAAMASADFSQTVNVTGAGAIASLGNSTNTTAQTLAVLIEKIKKNASDVRSSATGIEQSAQHIARDSKQQAIALQDATSSIDVVSSKVRENAEGALEAEVLAKEVAKRTREGSQTVQQTIDAVGRIAQGSRKVTEQLAVIDAIAFQTNLLALNAAVEAARAGDAGRGFAVVAAEVRALAQRSANAANDIKAVIQQNSIAVDEGVDLVEKTGTALSLIDQDLDKLTGTVGDISTASQSQAQGLSETVAMIAQIDAATEANASRTGESVSDCQRLLNVVASLDALVSEFKLSDAAANWSKGADAENTRSVA